MPEMVDRARGHRATGEVLREMKGDEEMDKAKIEEIKRELDAEPVPLQDARIYLLRYLVGRLDGMEAVPMELLEYVLDKEEREVSLIA